MDKDQEAKDKEQDAKDHEAQSRAEATNQITGLLVAFLDLRAWQPASRLLDHFKVLGIDVTVYGSVRASLCRFLAWQIQPLLPCTRSATLFKSDADLYKSVNLTTTAATATATEPKEAANLLSSVLLKTKYPAAIPDTMSSLAELPDAIQETMAAIGPHIATDIKLYHRVVRLVHEYCKSLSKEQRAALSACPKESSLMAVLATSIVPGLSLLESPGNTHLTHLVWAVLEDVSFDARFWIYHRWKGVLGKNTSLKVPQVRAKEDVKKLMRRVCTENVKASVTLTLNP